jgi:GTPase
LKETGFHSGFVAIIGRTNVGKSTFLNRILNRKVAIVSDKPQTTRNRIVGVYHGDQTQIVFLDTPGFHKPKHRLNEWMLRTTIKTLEGLDAILYVVEPETAIGPGDRYVLDVLRPIDTPVLLAINKIDLTPREHLLAVIESFAQARAFAEIIPMSALTNDNVDDVLRTIIRYMPEGPQYYPEDMVTDQPEQFVVAELIREQALQTTREEIPYSIAVVVDTLRPREDGTLLDIEATLYVERPSQKGILIGKSGRMLKQIGTRARQEIETLLGARVYLNLWVKVRKGWRMDEHWLRRLGYGNTS